MRNEVIEKELVIIDEETIKNKIYYIRGQQVMLDFELAEIYGYTTKNFNRQINRNIARFEGLIFKLEKYEIDILQGSHLATSGLWASGKGGRTYLPYAFTEQGVYMLMTVLRSKLAIEQSRKLISLFKDMKDYIVDSNHLLTTNEILKLSNQVHENTNDIKDIKSQLVVVMDNFIDPTKYKEYVIKDGERYLSDVLYHDIYALAKSSIHLVDDYISIKTLDLFRNVNKDIKIYIHSDNLAKDKVSDIVLEDFIKDTGLNISIIKSNNKYHDRFILIDDTHLYVCGGSSKDSGYKITTIIEMSNPKVIESIKNEII